MQVDFLRYLTYSWYCYVLLFGIGIAILLSMTTNQKHKGENKMEKLQHIQNITDSRGNVHSVLIYGKGDLRLGNKKFSSMKWVKYYIEEVYGVKV